METIIIEDLTVAYDIKPVIWDIDLNVKPGRLTAVVGPNGAGKSTLIKSIMGLVKPVSGKISFTEGKNIAYVPQTGSVDWDFPATVEDIVLMGRYGHIGWIKRPTKEDRAIADAMIEKVGMTEFKNRQISQLSGGQQQRVFLARALTQDADIYILDEPLKGVDVKTEKILMDLLRELANRKKTVLVVHHDLGTLKQYFDELVLINVRLIASGPMDSTLTRSHLLEAYQSDVSHGIVDL